MSVTLLIIYGIGVVLAFIFGIIAIHLQGKFSISDCIYLIILSLFSWMTIVVFVEKIIKEIINDYGY